MVRKLIIALAASAATATAFIPTVASADWWGGGIRHDRYDIHRDRADLRRDWRDLSRDVWYGSRRDIAHDLADVRRDQRDLRHDRYDLYWDRRGY
jgi:hypothetical protein